MVEILVTTPIVTVGVKVGVVLSESDKSKYEPNFLQTRCTVCGQVTTNITNDMFAKRHCDNCGNEWYPTQVKVSTDHALV